MPDRLNPKSGRPKNLFIPNKEPRIRSLLEMEEEEEKGEVIRGTG